MYPPTWAASCRILRIAGSTFSTSMKAWRVRMTIVGAVAPAFVPWRGSPSEAGGGGGAAGAAFDCPTSPSVAPATSYLRDAADIAAGAGGAPRVGGGAWGGGGRGRCGVRLPDLAFRRTGNIVPPGRGRHRGGRGGDSAAGEDDLVGSGDRSVATASAWRVGVARGNAQCDED